MGIDRVAIHRRLIGDSVQSVGLIQTGVRTTSDMAGVRSRRSHRRILALPEDLFEIDVLSFEPGSIRVRKIGREYLSSPGPQGKRLGMDAQGRIYIYRHFV
jgi:hypothetical protein